MLLDQTFHQHFINISSTFHQHFIIISLMLFLNRCCANRSLHADLMMMVMTIYSGGLIYRVLTLVKHLDPEEKEKKVEDE